MSFAADIEAYRERQSRMVGISPSPIEHSVDNGLLFTATAYILGAITREDLGGVVYQCMLRSGSYARFPGEPDPSSWDDHLGLACASQTLAKNIYHYGYFNGWTWGGKFLARIPIFFGTVSAGAGVPLTWWAKLYTALPFVTDCFVRREETNGRCTLYLAQKVLTGRSALLDQAMRLWRWRMSRIYPGGMREVYGIYFGEEHPFAKHGPDSFA